MRFVLSALAGLLLACLGLEALLQTLPVNSGARMQNSLPSMPYAHYLPQQSFVYSYGWALNNTQKAMTSRDGFVNSRDFDDGANALVIGDSFIEAYMLPYGDTVQGRLDATLGKVYAAASSGNGLADALQLSRHFLPRIHPKTAVLFVEPWDLRSIDATMGRGHNSFAFDGGKPTVAFSPYVESGMKLYLLRSALLRYMYYNLKLPDSLQGKGVAGAPRAVDAVAQAARVQKRDAAIDYLLAELAGLQRQYGTRFVFLVDADRAPIYANGKATRNWLPGDREFLLGKLRAAGFGVVDMQPIFVQHWGRYHERMDSLPMDGHWNSVGHKLAADGVLELLKADRPDYRNVKVPTQEAKQAQL
jgi:hypothetical protein